MEPTRRQLAQRARRQRESDGSVKNVRTPTPGSQRENNVHPDDGLIERLGESLPEANGYTSADEQQNANHQLLAEHSAVPNSSIVQPQKAGKLRRTNHMGYAAGHQRRMGKTTKVRPDQYYLEVSPQKPRHAPSGLLNGPPQPSPLKKQRKAQQAANVRVPTKARPSADPASTLQLPPTVLEAEELSSPRRSPRKSKGSERAQSPQVQIEQTHDNAEYQHEGPEQDQTKETTKTAPDEDELAQSHNSIAQSSAQKRRPGRPRKQQESAVVSIEARDSDVESQNDQPNSPRMTEQPSSGKRPRGRPPKQRLGHHDPKERDGPLESTQEAEQVEVHENGTLFVSETGADEDEDSDGSDGSTEEPGPLRIDTIRKSGMFPTDAPNNLIDDTELDAQPDPQAQKRKRSPEQAKSSKAQKKKRRFTSQVDQPEAADASLGELEAEDDDQNDHRLLGQWQALNRVFRSVNRVGVSIKDGEEQATADIDLRDADVIEIKRLCMQAKEIFKRLKDEPESRQQLTHSPAELDEIWHRVRGLCGKNNDYPTDFGSKRKVENIYFWLIPRILVKLLRRMIQCYYEMDKTGVTEAHLITITKFIRVILEMGAGAESYTTRPDTALALVKPVHNGLIVPLRNIRTAFAEHLAELEQSRQARQRQIQRQAENARRERREQQEKRHKAERAKLQKKWMSLHDSRRFVERGLISHEKQKHLRFPDPAQAEPEYDSIGRSFQRQSVFTSRIGPLPAAAEKARCMIWPTKAIEALQLGLKRHAGQYVYEKIFAEHCCDARGVLNPYNVTEIAVTAAGLKKYLEKDDLEKLGYVQEWVEAIPVWPREYSYVDKEDVIEDEQDEQDENVGEEV